eukprot:scaffold13331_cov18-Tisochrysis_lutea.AAC.1
MLSGNSAPCNDPTIGDRSKRPHERLLYAPEDAVSPITDVGIAWTQDPCVPAELCRAAREGPSHFNKLGDVFPFYENQAHFLIVSRVLQTLIIDKGGAETCAEEVQSHNTCRGMLHKRAK